LRRCLLPDAKALRPAVFLDRDGTISEEMGYLNHASRFRMFPFAGPAIRKLNEAGIVVVVVTNQSGVARGFFPEALLDEVHQIMNQELAAQQAKIDGVYYCQHGSTDDCDCRKPKPGMIRRAAEELGLNVSRSFVVGDRYSDVETGFQAGVRTVFVKTGYGLGEWTWRSKGWPRQPDYVAGDLLEAVEWILRQPR
jgi:D-glycero-D-manno-heptose 1,7-bisphosphate phosphatase